MAETVITVEHGNDQIVRGVSQDAAGIHSCVDVLSGEVVAGFRIDTVAKDEGLQVTFRLAGGGERAFILDSAMLRALADLAAGEVALRTEPVLKPE